MGLEFIQDVIYGLKIDMGVPIVVSFVENISNNQATGQKTKAIDSFTINLAIPLPENLRYQFLTRTFANQQKQGALDMQGEHILIDKADIPIGKPAINPVNCYITHRNKNYKVVNINDYTYALDIIVNGSPNLQIG